MDLLSSNKKSMWNELENNGLPIITSIVLEYYHLDKKSPSSGKNKLMGKILGAIRRGMFEKQNIKSWNDLLLHANLPLNKRSRPFKQKGNWRGKVGFKNAQNTILEYYSKHKKNPTAGDVPTGIYAAVRKQEYSIFGIKNWEEFINSTGLVFKDKNIWKGEKGLERIKEYIRNNFVKLEIPVNSQKLPLGMRSAIYKNFKKFNIETFNDLLKQMGIKPQHEKNIWFGLEGLERAKQSYYNAKNRLNRIPNRNELEDWGSIANALSRDYWIEFQVNVYADIVRECGDEPNYERKWIGFNGLSYAVIYLNKIKLELG